MAEDLKMKMSLDDGRKIWMQLKRFPFYDDLKELNDKFLPELAKI
jgi:hypothetical protein